MADDGESARGETAIGTARDRGDWLPERFVVDSAPSRPNRTWRVLVRAVLGGVALSGFYLVLVPVSPSGMGMGDVKAALVSSQAVSGPQRMPLRAGYSVLARGPCVCLVAGCVIACVRGVRM